MTRLVPLVLALALFAAGCAKPAGETASPAADSSAGVLEPPPQLAAVDAALMTGTWQWVGTNRPADRVAPPDPSHYTIAFQDTTVSVRADCNRGSGRLTLIEGQRMEIGPIVQTQMGCPAGSLDSEFTNQLGAVEAYQVSGDTLSITLKLEGGTMRFVKG